MNDRQFRRYISQRCIGYDFARDLTYLECRVEFTDGSTDTVYETRRDRDGAIIEENEHRPFVPNPLPVQGENL